MRRILRDGVISATIACAWLTPALAQDASVDDLAWMAGHWRAADGANVSEEGWFGPAGGLMLGLGRTVEDGAAVSFEYMRIEDGADAPVFVAQPNGGAPVRFALADAGETFAVFENPQNDYPQRVRYVRSGDTLSATISDLSGGDAISWSWELMP